jgi:hypothetical protein
MNRYALIGVALSLVVVLPAAAREYSPRVVSPHHADTYSMKSFAQFHRWRDLKDDRLAWEVYQYLTDRRTGLFPLGKEVYEGRDVLPEFRIIRDPVKLINVYGYGFCGILGPTMAGIWHDMEAGPSRTLILPGWNHVVGEVFYAGQWHYLDLDCRAAFRRPDGSLASMAEAQQDDALWKGPSNPVFFPLDPLPEVRKVYAKTPVHPYYGYHFSGHTMDFILRQGETFTRWWKPQDGRWLHWDTYHRDDFFRKLFEREPRGPKCKHAGWTVHTHGNGRFVYQPNLTEKSSDFEDGVYSAENVQSTAAGLTLTKAGKGQVVFEVRSPYVIVPLVGKVETGDDDREASVVKLDASGVKLALSLDNGTTWKELSPLPDPPPQGGRETLVDLTPHVAGTYGYLLRITLEGEPGKAVVRSLGITTWVQVAPASLPGLGQGVNRMEYRSGDHHGLPTRALEIRTNGNDRADFLKYLHEPPKDFDSERRTQGRAKGPFTVKLQAPPGCRISWFSAGGNFVTHRGADAKNTRNSIAYAVNEPKDFRPLYQAEVPPDQGHWHINADKEVKLATPAKTVYLRYEGDPGVNNLRIYAHCLDDRPVRRSPVTITHAWREKGVLLTHRQTLDKPGSYEIITGADPEDEYIEMSIPSRP